MLVNDFPLQDETESLSSDSEDLEMGGEGSAEAGLEEEAGGEEQFGSDDNF